MIYVLVGHWAVGAPLGIYLCEVYGMGAIDIWIGLAAGTFLTTLLTVARLFTRKHAFRGGQPNIPGVFVRSAPTCIHSQRSLLPESCEPMPGSRKLICNQLHNGGQAWYA